MRWIKGIALLILIALGANLNAQSSGDTLNNIIYVTGPRQGLYHLKYERRLLKFKWTQTIASIGIGYMPGEVEPPRNDPSDFIITPEIAQLFGTNRTFLELGIEPSINFYGNVTYVDLNAIIGIRGRITKNEMTNGFWHLGYNPRLFYSHTLHFDLPIYFGFGQYF